MPRQFLRWIPTPQPALFYGIIHTLHVRGRRTMAGAPIEEPVAGHVW
jgi:hypothetical protein